LVSKFSWIQGIEVGTRWKADLDP